jgi:hypothetical protein
MSRGIADDPEDLESESEPVSNEDLSEMIFIVFNEVKLLGEKLDRLLDGKG